jgi:tetratricopeptide (TPR) repeat protein
MTPSSPKHYDVFISFATADKPWVDALAANLHNAGLEVFYAPWEIGPGDSFVKRLDWGLEKSRNGVLVVSRESLDRPWVQEEYAVLLRRAVEEKDCLLIPVLYQDAPLPQFLAHRNWIDFRAAAGPLYDQRVDELVAALRGNWKGRPEPEPGKRVSPPGDIFKAEGPVYRTLRIEGGETLLIGEKTTKASWGSRAHALDDKVWQLEQELRRHGEETHRDGASGGPGAAQRLHACQLAAGAALAEVFLPEAVAEALRADLAAAVSGGSSLRLGLETPESMLGLPWETLCLAPGEPLALHPRVSFYRRVTGLGPTPALQVPGPLRILVAIGSPEAQNARGELLDMEAELARILDAVEPARKQGRAVYVRILENGTVAAIREALEAERYHVLHLSCHAGPGVLILEDGDGGEDRVDAERLWSKALPADRGVPLVVLGGCSTALDARHGEEALPGLARGLLERGVPAVVAMRASVGDLYATAFCAALYKALATGEEPLPLHAFVEARRMVEDEREAGDFRGRSEWSTPLLFLRGEGDAAAGLRLYDPKGQFGKIVEPSTMRLAAGVLVRRVGDFVGRRADQRKILRLLRDPEHGGVLVRGLGGLGKSSLSAQLAQKLSDEGWLVVSLFGETNPDGIFEEVGKLLLSLALGAGLPENHPVRAVAQAVRRRDIEASDRLEYLGQHVLEQMPLLLLLDNFEDNLTPLAAGASSFKNPQLAALLTAWLERPGRSRLLLTCRYPLPLEGIAARRLADHALGPLSPAEARKLFLRLDALEERSREEQERIRVAVGGHPRALEYLDALLRGGRTRFADIAERLEDALRKKGVENPRAWLGQDGGDLDAALVKVVTLAADDVLLDELLERLRPIPLAERLLLGASVFRLPVEEKALVWQVGEPPGLPRYLEPDPLPEVAVPADFAAARDALAGLGLLAPVGEGIVDCLWLVHRWTATRLAERHSADEMAEAHRHAALYWQWRVTKVSHSLEEHLEARHHHYLAGELDEAVLVTEWICSQLDIWGAYRREEQLIHELLGWLPEKSKTTAASYHHLGIIAQQRGDYDQALDWYLKSLNISEELGNRADMARSYHHLGMVAQDRGDYDQALDWYRKSLDIKEGLGNRAGMASSYHQLGIVAHLRGDYDQSLDWYRKSLDINEELGNRAEMAPSYHHLGMVAQERGDYDQALDWYRKSLDINKEFGNRFGIASSYHHLGIVAHLRGDYDEALDWYRKSLYFLEELGNQAGVASSYHQLGRVAEERGDYDQALNWYHKSLDINEKLGNRAGMADSYHHLGIVAQQCGNYDQALDRYRQSLDMNEQLGNLAGMASSYGQMAVLLMTMNEPAKAVPLTLRSLSIHRQLQVPQIRTDLLWLGRQRERLGDEPFREILAEHLGADSQAAVFTILDRAAGAGSSTP